MSRHPLVCRVSPQPFVAKCLLLHVLGVAIAVPCWAEDDSIKKWLSRGIISDSVGIEEVKDFVEQRVPRPPRVTDEKDWQDRAQQIRQDVLDKVVFRGRAVEWRDAKMKVEWQQTIDGGPGYQIKKLRYEALPGMWIPALLYEPTKLTGKVPVVMNVNGHERNAGKAAAYKQIRCINQAKRGMIALNVEWLGMGQLRAGGFDHYKMNQLDLCGTSGLAPFYLTMSRGLDVLLGHEHADPARVAVAGLSGGGWQTIIISALDTRVTLANPVAGYSSFITRIHHSKDLGDSEQTPSDLATVADYTHLTALLAPRPALLTYNARDNCCFESGYALPPLLSAAKPVYSLYGKASHLAAHTNKDPGDHNFGKDNRQALYRMLATHFSSDAKSLLPLAEIDCAKEVKTKEELSVALPENNADFHTLAMEIAKGLEHADIPAEAEQFPVWKKRQRAELVETIQAKLDYKVVAQEVARDSNGATRAVFWRLRIADQWTVPAVEIVRGDPQATVIVIADKGRSTTSSRIVSLLDQGNRVVAVDAFYFGESRIRSRDFLYALLVATVGERPLGIQASQVAAIARWLDTDRKLGAPFVNAYGPRTSLIALTAAAIEDKSVSGLRLHESFGSLKQVIEQDLGVNKMPELFCFGLLERFDIARIAALTVPRKVSFHKPSERARRELADLRKLYARAGKPFDPLQ